MKRVQRKQLKEDELLSGLNRFLGFVKKWTREIILFVVIVLGGLLLFSGFRLVKAQQTKRESRTLGQILALRSESSGNPGNLAKLEQLAGQGKFSRVAFILLANYWVEQSRLDKAQEYLGKIKPAPKDFFYYQAQHFRAQIEILRGNPERAVEILKKIEEEKPETFVLDAVLTLHAEALEKKGEKKEALNLYKRLQEEFPQTYYGYEASQKVRKLESEK
ncbi:MAG: tetratricopeptide repeat protein [Candidatus Aminicenantales bacterium]